MVGQRSNRSWAARGLRRDSAHDGASEGAADQQKRPERCAWDCPDDAGRPFQASACEDAAGSGATNAVDEPQASAEETARRGMRSAWHAAQFWAQSWRGLYREIRSTDPRAGHGF